jgi:hypothetical protein
MNLLQNYILTNGFSYYEKPKINLEKKDIYVKPFNKGICFFKNKKRNCPIKQTYIIENIGKCVCEYHLTSNPDRILNLIDFYKKMDVYKKRIFLYKDDKENFIENLKDILLLVINYKKYKYTLAEYYYMVNSNLDNFDIQDDEYLALVNYFKSINF